MRKDNKSSSFISLLEKAANTTSEGITISNMSADDRPLIYANKGFEYLTGYSIDEVIGKNCRFLQGDESEQAAVEEIRKAIRNGEECTVELLNYKKDGTPFWNRLSLTPLKNKAGTVTHYVGVQSDITELKETKKRLELANRDLEVFHEKITRDLNQARKAQKFILPDALPQNNKVTFSARYEPMDQIGGDYYDTIELQRGVYGILIADVTGHGIPAALLTFMTSMAFKNSTENLNSTKAVVTSTNDKLINKMPKGAFTTMFYAIYNSNTNTLTYTQAGHPPGFIIRPTTREVIPLSTQGGLVGVFQKSKISYGENKIRLQRGDKFLLYTDAIVEARNNQKQMIEMNDFTDFLSSICTHPISEILDEVYQFGINYSGKPKYDDDFTLVGFEVLS